MCNCGSNPCGCQNQCNCGCDVNNEGVQSQLNNIVKLLFGDITKTCVNGQVVWTEPCNLADGLNACYPRLSGEGLLCYFMRILKSVAVLPSGTYSAAVTYCLRSSVIYGGNSYVSKADNNINNQPDISPSFWQQF